MSFTDKVIECADCGQEFIHSAQDQERYAERGFTNEPKRCRECRAKRKADGGGGGGGRQGGPRQGGRDFDRRGGGGGGGGGGFRRGPRASFPATCAACGQETTVPFEPVAGRPVYCRSCFESRR